MQMAASGAGVPMRREVLQLYRSLLRVARQFCDYNIREYSKRRTMDAFRDNKNLRDPSQLSAAFSRDANYLKDLPSLPTRNEDGRDSFLVRCIHDLLDPSLSLYFHLSYLDSRVPLRCAKLQHRIPYSSRGTSTPALASPLLEKPVKLVANA
ncbi:hypothetical protein J1N35_008190 [Gossypium stocksii]|uniref:Complex 1 LYR protein domain-containing protein n=1 Tax=Gossypium stocksii TaxID=47602 RepID=A0A9D3W8Y8_9ROSI|nr:hypothetical protein J1N35_008190 [Gossypium stocksii]